MSKVNPGDIVEHRTSDDCYVVATTGLVCCVRMLEGARITDFFHPHELEVVERDERFVCGVDYAPDGSRATVTARVSTPGGMRAVADEYAATAGEPLLSDEQRAAAARMAANADENTAAMAATAIRPGGAADTIDEKLQRRRQEAFVADLTAAAGSVDVPLPGIHGKCCVSCNSWGADGCSQGRPCAPDGSSKACDEWAVTHNPWHAPKRADLDVEDARETLVAAGWQLLHPIRVEAGWEVSQPGWRDAIAEKAVQQASAKELSAALVDKGWTVAADEGGSRLYPPENLPRYVLDSIEAEALATELVRRGWFVVQPGGWNQTDSTVEMDGSAVTEYFIGQLTELGCVVVTPDDLPGPGCYECASWDSELPDPCSRGWCPTEEQMEGRAEPSCNSFKHRPENVAKHLAERVLALKSELEAGIAAGPQGPTFPTPPAGLEDDTLAAQLDWLRDNDLPTGKGAGKKAKTAAIVRLLRFGYYDPSTVEQLTGELQWPPGAAKCPVCGSETPEDCEHPLP